MVIMTITITTILNVNLNDINNYKSNEKMILLKIMVIVIVMILVCNKILRRIESM